MYRLTVKKIEPGTQEIETVIQELSGEDDGKFLLKLRSHLEWTRSNYLERESMWKYFEGEGMAFLGTAMENDFFINYADGKTVWRIDSKRHERSQEPESVRLIKGFQIYNHDTGENFYIESTTLLPFEPARSFIRIRSYQEILDEIDFFYQKKMPLPLANAGTQHLFYILQRKCF